MCMHLGYFDLMTYEACMQMDALFCSTEQNIGSLIQALNFHLNTGDNVIFYQYECIIDLWSIESMLACLFYSRDHFDFN